MIKCVCPICDQTMKGKHYCRVCKTWIKHPYVREVTYYLNEWHPESEMVCDYHMPEQTRPQKSQKKIQPVRTQPLSPMPSAFGGRPTARDMRRDHNKSSMIGGLVIVVMMLLFQCAA